MKKSVNSKENTPRKTKLVKRRVKKKSFLFVLFKLFILIGLLLFFLWYFSNGGSFWNFKDGGSQQTFQETSDAEPSISSSTGEEFLIITITEDQIYQGDTLIAFEDLKTSLSELPAGQKIKLTDNQALYRVFNEVKALLDEGSLVYIIE